MSTIAPSWQDQLRAEVIQKIIDNTPFKKPKDLTDLKVIVWSNQVLSRAGEISKEPIAKERVKALAREAILYTARETIEVCFAQHHLNIVALSFHFSRTGQREPNHKISGCTEDDFLVVDTTDTFSNRSRLLTSWMNNPSALLTQEKIHSILSCLGN